MEEMKNIERFTDKEWEELASILSGEKGEQSDLLGRYTNGDSGNSMKTWKELNNMTEQKEIDIDAAWNRVHSRIEGDNTKSLENPLRIIHWRSVILRIAAVALILLGLGSVTLYLVNSGSLSEKITVVSGNDQKNVLVSLNDGSKIYLNRNSEFSYRKNFGKHGRNVKLTGEAFFEIAPDASKPFIIDAGQANVKVVGTTFNVITNNSKSEVEVFVKTGKVLVSGQSGDQTIQLDPGYVGTINAKTSSKTLNNNPNYLSWKTGHLEYNGQKMSVVLSDLKRVYNMEIITDDSVLLNSRWSTPIENIPQETIIQLICTSFNLSYTKDGGVYHLTKK